MLTSNRCEEKEIRRKRSYILYKILISETATKAIVPTAAYNGLFQAIIDREGVRTKRVVIFTRR